MRLTDFGKFSLILILLSTSASCVLKRRDQPKDENANKQENPLFDATSDPTLIKNPYKNRPSHLEPQGQMDWETFYNPTDMEAREQAERTKERPEWKRLTGHKIDFDEKGALKDFAYTDSSPDFLMSKLRVLKRDPSLSLKQKQLSSEFAKEIKNVKIQSSQSARFSILVQYEVNRYYDVWSSELNQNEQKKEMITIQTKKLSGLSQEGGRYATLVEMKSNSNKEAQDLSDSEMKAELRCLDLEFQNKCSNYFLQLTRTKSDGTEAQAEIIVRSAVANINEITVNKDNDQALSSNTTRLLDLFNKTNSDHHFEDKLIKIHSLAVVDGISEFKLELETNKAESISIGGPLVTGLGNAIPIKYPLAKNPDFKVFNEKNKTKTDLNSLFDVALLDYNNGRGKIKITFENTITSKESPYTEGLTVTFTSKIPSVIKLDKESIYFHPEP